MRRRATRGNAQLVKNSLDHLNLQKQKEVTYIRKVILEELETRLRKSTSKRVARYRILKLVLYGSFARGTWFDCNGDQ